MNMGTRVAIPERLILASGNQGKLVELRAMMSHLPCGISPISEFSSHEPEETGTTFVENAIIKARHACEVSGCAAVADDSGIIVDALNGQPGVWSARFAGVGAGDEANLRLLLERLEGVPPAQRTARFVSIVVLMRHMDDPLPIVAEGIWEGHIIDSPRGENGFGYDPIFGLPGRPETSAEIAPEEKNHLSHRGQALRAMLRAAGWER